MSAVDRLLTRVGGVKLESVPLMDETRRKLLENALEFCNEILEDESDDSAVHREVGLAWARVGELQGLLGDQQAEKSLRRAIEIQRKLLAEFPDNPKHNDDAIRSHRQLAHELYQLGHYSDAEQILDDILNLAEFKTNVARSEQIVMHRLRGLMYASTQKKDEAVAACESALQLADALVQGEPTRSEFQTDRANVLGLLGSLYRESRRLDKAEKCLQDGKTVLEQQLAKEPTDVDLQNNVAALIVNLGLTYANLNRPVEAQSEYARAPPPP